MILLVTLTLVTAMLMSGCSAPQNKIETSLHVVVTAKYVSDANVEAFAKSIQEALPSYNNETKQFSFIGLSIGDGESDPMVTMGALTKFTGMMASNEVELLISDTDNASRNASNGDAFIPLSELFTEQEIASFTRETITLPMKDNDGNETGERTAPCGVDISDLPGVTQMMGADASAYIVANTKNLDAAKALFLHLATQP